MSESSSDTDFTTFNFECDPLARQILSEFGDIPYEYYIEQVATRRQHDQKRDIAEQERKTVSRAAMHQYFKRPLRNFGAGVASLIHRVISTRSKA